MTDLSPLRDIAIALGGDVAKDVLKAAARPWIDRYFRDHSTEAIAKAHENVDSFLGELDARVSRLETNTTASSARTPLSDPDLAATVQAAMIAAARTSSGERHKVLATVVAERLRSAPDGPRAVAGNFAVTIVPQLAPVHLEWLGMLAVIYAVRADSLIPTGEGITDENREERRAEAEAVADEYAAWLRQQFNVYAGIGEFTDDIATHLASTSATIFERKVRRDLVPTLLPRSHGHPGWGRSMFSGILEMKLHQDADLGWHGWITEQWNNGLQHARPTPAGLLIGCAVHDRKVGGSAASTWEWSNAPGGAGAIVEDGVWDGERIDRHFLDRLERELNEREEQHARRGGRR